MNGYCSGRGQIDGTWWSRCSLGSCLSCVDKWPQAILLHRQRLFSETELVVLGTLVLIAIHFLADAKKNRGAEDQINQSRLLAEGIHCGHVVKAGLQSRSEHGNPFGKMLVFVSIQVTSAG